MTSGSDMIAKSGRAWDSQSVSPFECDHLVFCVPMMNHMLVPMAMSLSFQCTETNSMKGFPRRTPKLTTTKLVWHVNSRCIQKHKIRCTARRSLRAQWQITEWYATTDTKNTYQKREASIREVFFSDTSKYVSLSRVEIRSDSRPSGNDAKYYALQ